MHCSLFRLFVRLLTGQLSERTGSKPKRRICHHVPSNEKAESVGFVICHPIKSSKGLTSVPEGYSIGQFFARPRIYVLRMLLFPFDLQHALFSLHGLAANVLPFCKLIIKLRILREGLVSEMMDAMQGAGVRGEV